MGAKRGTTSAEKAEMLRLRGEGKTYDQIADRFGCSRPNVAFILQAMGEPRVGEPHGAAPGSRLARRRAGYSNWLAMVQRCTDPGCSGWARYGKRGIAVDPTWRNSFSAFIRDIGPRPSLRHSIDRYPNKTGNYEPGNVRWALPGEQNRNRVNTLLVGAEPLVDAAKTAGVPYGLARARLHRGLAATAILTPLQRPIGCASPSCDGEHWARGFCSKHYRKFMGMGRKGYRSACREEGTI